MRKPLIVMSPKSLLRHPLAVSSMDELASGVFHNVIDEIDELDTKKVKRVIMCSGKVYYDLLEQRRKNEQTDVAIVIVVSIISISLFQQKQHYSMQVEVPPHHQRLGIYLFTISNKKR